MAYTTWVCDELYKPMSQLSDFIQAARSAGKTDDVISRELSSQGWPDADISQALGGSASPTPNVAPIPPPVVAAGGGVSAVAIGVGVLVVALLGGGAYYAFNSSDDAATLETEASKSPVVSTSQQGKVASYLCADILATSDVQRFTQDASPVEVELDNSSEDITVCSFTQAEHVIAVSISTDANISANQLYDITRSAWIRNVELARAQGVVDTSKLEVKDVQGIGAKAFSAVVAFMPTMGVLSTDGRTFFTVGTLSDAAAGNLQDIAKLVDVNVSKH